MGSASEEYRKNTQIVLAVIILACYWLAGTGSLLAISMLKADVRSSVDVGKKFSLRRKRWTTGALSTVLCMDVALFVASIYHATR